MAIQYPAQQLSALPNAIARSLVEPSLENLSCATCTTCVTFDVGLCAAIRKINALEADRILGAPLIGPVQTSPARRTICHPTEWSEFVTVICQGWATTSIALSDGRRQILSFLLPGDLMSTSSLFEPTSGRLVEAVTEVTYRNYKRGDLKALMVACPDVLETLTKLWLEERKHAEQLAVDLGRRTADERIARLILNLMEKLIRRGMAQDQTIEFPLRQHHIADATGLTPVHVSKVLSEFRRADMIEISNRSLTVLDPTRFRRMANMS